MEVLPPVWEKYASHGYLACAHSYGRVRWGWWPSAADPCGGLWEDLGSSSHCICKSHWPRGVGEKDWSEGEQTKDHGFPLPKLGTQWADTLTNFYAQIFSRWKVCFQRVQKVSPRPPSFYFTMLSFLPVCSYFSSHLLVWCHYFNFSLRM